MPFEHACFVSYRHGREPGTAKLYRTFRDELAVQLELYLPGMGVFFDEKRLAGGDFFEEEIRRALSHSVCMILLFTPQYFSERHTFCAREYRAMVELERQRLAAVPALGQGKGLVLPVVLRGRLVDELKMRQAFTFGRTLLADSDLRLRSTRIVMEQIARAVYVRHEAFRVAGFDPCTQCNGVRMPAEPDILGWVRSVAGGMQPFPWSETP
jgi:hypothetical protein